MTGSRNCLKFILMGWGICVAMSCASSSSPAARTPQGTGDAKVEACLQVAGARRQKRADEPTRILAKHILVKYQGTKGAPAEIKRSRGEACLRAMQARDEILHGAEFDATVAKYSDEPGAATRGGSIGTITRDDVLPQFADAAFELTVRQMSDVVETEAGFHVILRQE